MEKNKKVLNKLIPYFLTSFIVLILLMIIFIFKDIYPFGRNSLIFGDMHDQITAFYYHFYDAIKGNGSLLIDFSTSSGINFIGILAYYILSPFSILVFLVKRTDIYLVVSIIIALKILCCSLTCLYFIRTYYKKLPNLLSILLAIIYAFSGYSLIMYQITSWIDAMYMLPLIMIGLKKVLDLEKPTMYILTLSLSLIFSFYVTIMVLIFIFLSSFIYLLVYQDDKKLRKKAIFSLGLSTIISLLLSLFIIVPAYLQISISSRLEFSLKTLLNSKTGPITDKISMFLFGGLMYIGIYFLLKNWKQNQKFLTFYIPVLLIVLIPALIEPINKFWHFGSYAFFPYRFGFITTFLLILGACQGFYNFNTIKSTMIKKTKTLSIVLTIFVSLAIFIIIFSNYSNFQNAINTLTISYHHSLLLILLLALMASIIGIYIIFLLNKKLTTFSLLLIMIITMAHILANASIYLGIDEKQQVLMNEYIELGNISKNYQKNDYYRVKNEANNMIMNSGMVMKYHTLDHFTSLTDRNNLESLKKLGYSSMWVKTFSRGGNLFLDSILANKYLITREKKNNEYYTLTNTYHDLNFYTMNLEPSYGYLLNDNDTIFDKANSFEISNSFYQNITGTKDNIFDIIDIFDLKNIKATKNSENTSYEIIDSKDYSYFEKTFLVTGKKTIYLEILKSLINNDNYDMYEKFNIYINDRLFSQKAFSENNNGVLNLGTYQDETMNLKIELLDNVDLKTIAVGMMDNSKYEEFIEKEKIDTNITYQRNKVLASVNTKEEKILFLPISYNIGYHAVNNQQQTEILKLYDNYIGIKLHPGINNIEISFIPEGLIPCLIIGMITLVLSIILISTNWYQKILDIKILHNLMYYFYLILYLAFVLVIYIGLTICFIISYFVPILP